MGMVIFEESGTFNPADWGLQVGDMLNIVCVGGGGGGGNGRSESSSAYGATTGGGGAGGDVTFATHKLTALTPIVVTIGAGGAQGTDGEGVAGGTSSFGSFVSSLGGPGGAAGTNGYGWYDGIKTSRAMNSKRMSAGGVRVATGSGSGNQATGTPPGGGGGYFPGYPFFGGDADGGDKVLAGDHSRGSGFGAGGPGGDTGGYTGGAGVSGVVVVTW